jgi:protein MpaA
VERLKPDRIVAIHSIARGRHCNNFDGDGEDLAFLMAAHNRYRATSTIGYPTPGSFGNWAGIDHGIPTITLELPRDADAATCWRENRDALLAFIRSEAVLAK